MDILKNPEAVSALRWVALSAALAYTAAQPFSFKPPSLSTERAHGLRAELDEVFAGGHWGEALFIVHRLLQSFPEDSIYLNRQAEIYNRLGDYRSESAAYELSLSLSPTPTESCPAIGRSYAKQGLKEKALDADRRCLALEPTNCDLQIFYALALERNGRYEEARKGFEATLALAPNYKDAADGLARVKARISKAEK